MKKFNLIKSISILALSLTASFASAAMLKSDKIEVTANVVTLGDLFHLEGALADQAIFKAPPLSRTGGLPATSLAKIADQFGIDWQNEENISKISISRKAATINSEYVKELIKDYAISNQHVASNSGQTNIILHDKFKDIMVGSEEINLTNVLEFTYRPYNDQFNVKFEYVRAGQRRTKSLTGKIENMVRLPVFATNIRKNQTIGLVDIKYIQVNNRFVAQNIVTDPEMIIGMAAKNSIRANLPISSSMLKHPDLVKQNSIISLKFNVGRVKLNIKARALNSGPKDSLIRVMNLKSGKQIDAIVIGKDLAMTINSENHDSKKIASTNQG